MEILRFALGARFPLPGAALEAAFEKECLAALLQALRPKDMAGLQLYGGLALYKAGDPSADSGAWMASDVIDRQRAELARIGFAGWGLYSDAYLPQ